MDEGIAVYSFKTAGKGEDFGGIFPFFSLEDILQRYTQAMGCHGSHVPGDTRWSEISNVPV